jgi:hypothetical protein
MVAYEYNSSCLDGGDQEDHGSRTAWGKSSQPPHLNQLLGGWHAPVISAVQRSTHRSPDLKQDSISRITNAKKYLFVEEGILTYGEHVHC